MKIGYIFIGLFVFICCVELNLAGLQVDNVFLDKLKVPEGLEVSIWAQVPNTRSLDKSEDGDVIFSGTYNFRGIEGHNNNKTRVYAMRDNNGNGFIEEDERFALTDEIPVPNGVAYHEGDLYIACVDFLLKIPDVLKDLGNPAPAQVLIPRGNIMPGDPWHGWRYIRVSPDGEWLYMAIGAPCNTVNEERPHCIDEPYWGTIQKLPLSNPTAFDANVPAHGVRNSVGFTWDSHGNFWFTENGRDWLETGHENSPSDELNIVREENGHYGFPYCYGYDTPDPLFNTTKEICASGDTYIPASLETGAHAASLGLRFYDGKVLPAKYQGAALIANHGSWNRESPAGYSVTAAFPNADDPTIMDSIEPFLSGFLSEEPTVCTNDDDCPGNSHCQLDTERYQPPYHCSGWGRPSDVEILPSGAVLVSDELNGVIYKIDIPAAATRNFGPWIAVIGGIGLVSGLIYWCQFVRSKTGNYPTGYAILSEEA